MRELEITPEQRGRIQNLRTRVKGAVKDLRAAMALLRELRSHVKVKHTSFDERMRELQNILTPMQSAKLILWVTRSRPKLRMSLSLKDMFGAGDAYATEKVKGEAPDAAAAGEGGAAAAEEAR